MNHGSSTIFYLPSDLQENDNRKNDENYHNSYLCQNKTSCKISFQRKRSCLVIDFLHLSFENHSWSDIFGIWLHFTMLFKQYRSMWEWSIVILVNFQPLFEILTCNLIGKPVYNAFFLRYFSFKTYIVKW